MKAFLLFLFITVSSYCVGQQLVYKPINPAFVGGEPFNYSWLLNSANSNGLVINVLNIVTGEATQIIIPN